MSENKKCCGNCSLANRWEDSTVILKCENPLSGAYNTPVMKTEYCNRHRKATKEWEKHISGGIF